MKTTMTESNEQFFKARPEFIGRHGISRPRLWPGGAFMTTSRTSVRASPKAAEVDTFLDTALAADRLLFGRAHTR
ncbi:hypothetical protein [Streptomyces hygroscopicus]|uniref:hypothetical protein n=1 Tax=Streptomyces hygroscopicus TaxID=1912 RepID=UPI003792EE94